jgi:pimeloyl-ACP methyl ester carboxylesterase
MTTREATPAERPVVEESVVSVDGGRLRVLDGGTGAALLYLHGVGDLGGWIPALDRLATAYRVIRPDHPGFNGSDDLSVRTPADIARVHARLLDLLGIDSVVVVGCSFGGWVATELALLEPERVTRLVLIDPAGMPADEVPPQVLHLGPVESAPLTFSAPAMQAAARERSRVFDTATLARDVRNRETAARLAGGPHLQDPTLPERAAAIAQPVTILWGADDRIIPVSHAASWTAAVPHAQLSVIPGAGHLPHAEQPGLFFARAGLGVPAC